LFKDSLTELAEGTEKEFFFICRALREPSGQGVR